MRKHKKKKKGILLLSILLLLVVGVACGESDNEMQPETDAPVVTEPEDENTPDEPNESGEQIDEEELEDLFVRGTAIEEVSYTIEMKGYLEETMISKVWMSGEKMRFETTIMGNTVITMMDGDAFYTMSGNEKMAMKMPMNEVDDPTENALMIDDMTDNIDSEAFEKLGKETINGIDCYVIKATDQFDGTSVKMWLHEDYGMVMKMETEIADEMGSYMMEVTDFKVGNIPNDIFTVPDDFEVVDFSEFDMPVMPNMPTSP